MKQQNAPLGKLLKSKPYCYAQQKGMIKRIKNIHSWCRIWIWGFCPKCNSDAPDLYECPVCEWDTKSPFGKHKKKENIGINISRYNNKKTTNRPVAEPLTICHNLILSF